jgi:hypothetical protein
VECLADVAEFDNRRLSGGIQGGFTDVAQSVSSR